MNTPAVSLHQEGPGKLGRTSGLHFCSSYSGCSPMCTELKTSLPGVSSPTEDDMSRWISGMRMLRCGQAARGVNAGPPKLPPFTINPSEAVSSPLHNGTTSPPPPPPSSFLLLLYPGPGYPRTAAACLGDPQLVITTEQLPSPLKMRSRRRDEEEVGQQPGWSRYKNQLREGSVQDKPWGLG